jgi:predicted AlkP superfamily phosphohydrolase/phosphomutase/tetratricopeptide (TPR) repeat protein
MPIARIGARRLLLFALLLAGLARPAWSSAAPAARTGPPPARVLLVGLDAADWQIANPLIEAGRLPHLARLRREGAWTDLRSTTPMLSPLLWTSLATGKTPGEHGIIDFLVTDPRTGRKVPIASTFRKTKAIWNILSEQGRTADFIGWWATWPAETINGHMVSDRFAYSLFGYQQSAEDLVGIASPESWIRNALRLRVSEQSVTLQDIQRFAAVSAADFAAARERLAADPRQSYSDPLNHLMKILASTRTYHALALDRLRAGKPDVLSVYYQGIDEVGHRFGHYLPPKLAWVDAASFEKYHDVVSRFYEYQDELLGELLAVAGPGMTVVVLSDHGFLSGSDRPDVPPDNEAKAGLWHRLYGILVMAGPGIQPGKLETASLYDVTPTLLHLSGLPIAADMAGKPILDALTPAFQAANKLSTIATYEDPAGSRRDTAGSLPGSSAAIDEEILARLKSLGYIAATDIDSTPGSEHSTPATVNNLLNAAALHMSQGRADAAEAVLRQALAETPKNATAHSMLSEALEAQRKIEESALAARTALNLTAEPQERLVERYAGLARRLSRLDECKAFFLRYAQQRPGRAEPWLGLGFAQSMAGDMKGAESSFLRALEMNPRSVAAVTGLYNVFERSERSREILQAVRAAVEANPDSAAHHTLLGMFHAAARDTRGAEAELRRALELDPDRDAALAALGDLLLETGRVEEARRLLEKAIARQGNLIEVRLSLGRVYGKMGRMGEATRQMSEAVRLDPRSATAHGQLGMMQVMQERPDRAVPLLERAIELDPDLYELRLHLAVQYHALKKPEACEAVLKAALSRRPGEPEAVRLLASLYRETGREEEAERLIARPPAP